MPRSNVLLSFIKVAAKRAASKFGSLTGGQAFISTGTMSRVAGLIPNWWTAIAR